MRKKVFSIKCDETVVFQERINRFTVSFHFKGRENELELAHLHDTGRMKELLIKGNELMIRKAENPNRKTKWDVIAVKVNENDKEENVLINSSFHRYIAQKIFENKEISPFGNVDKIVPEIKIGKSRLDFYLEKEGTKGEKIDKIYIETKGCTLVDEKNRARFPGAPSERATKHLQELMKLKKLGDRASAVILIFRESEFFMSENEIDPKFFETYVEAKNCGVEIYGLLFSLDNKGDIYFERKIDVF